MDSCVVSDYSVYPWIIGTALVWAFRSEPASIQPRLRPHSQQPQRPHCSFDFGAILTNADSYDYLYVSWHPVRLRSVACNSASDSRMVGLPVTQYYKLKFTIIFSSAIFICFVYEFVIRHGFENNYLVRARMLVENRLLPEIFSTLATFVRLFSRMDTYVLFYWQIKFKMSVRKSHWNGGF